MKNIQNNTYIELLKKIQFMVFFIIFCSYILSCNTNGNTSSKKINHFIPKLNDKNTVMLTAQGDTIWHQIPSFSFIDENGNEITQEFMDNNIVIVDFFFTTCPSICIPMSQNLGKIQQHFKNDEEIKILSHTVDPKRDTPDVLKAYATSYNADPKKWKFATGSKKSLYKQAREAYFITAIDGDGGATDFIHSEKLVLIDKNKNIRGFFRGTVDEDIQKLIKSIELLKLEYQ